MEEFLNIENKKDSGFEKIDIYCLRILAEKVLKDTPILFNVSGGCVVPIDICIKPCPCPEDIEKKAAETLVEESKKLQELINNNTPTDTLLEANARLAKLICNLKPKEDCFDKEIKCIESIKVVCIETREDFICNHKVRLYIMFKILLIVKLMDDCLGLILLPSDMGKKICFSNVTFPIVHVSDGIKKILDLKDCNEFFSLIIEMPLKEFKGQLPSYIFDNPTLQSIISVKCIKHVFDIFGGICTCDCDAKTHISLLSTADITDKIGVKQDVWLYGKPDDC